MGEEVSADDVAFNSEIIAAAWEAFEDGIPAVAAAALVNEYTDATVTANDGVESDRDVHFPDAEIMVEEKAMGVCAKATAEEFAPAFIQLSEGKALAMNPGQIFEDHTLPA